MKILKPHQVHAPDVDVNPFAKLGMYLFAILMSTVCMYLEWMNVIHPCVLIILLSCTVYESVDQCALDKGFIAKGDDPFSESADVCGSWEQKLSSCVSTYFA